MKILDDGTVLADDWEHIEEDSIKRYTEQMDMGKKMLWEDDQIVDMQTGFGSENMKHIVLKKNRS